MPRFLRRMFHRIPSVEIGRPSSDACSWNRFELPVYRLSNTSCSNGPRPWLFCTLSSIHGVSKNLTSVPSSHILLLYICTFPFPDFLSTKTNVNLYFRKTSVEKTNCVEDLFTVEAPTTLVSLRIPCSVNASLKHLTRKFIIIRQQ